ncbi:Ig-like domain-containing protein [Luedemannella flava]
MPLSDPNTGQTVTARLGAAPHDGTTTVWPDGNYVYEPDPGFSGIDRFTVVGCDNAPVPLCSTGTVTLRVSPVAHADAVAAIISTPVTIDVLANDIAASGEVTTTDPAATVDPDDRTITFTSATPGRQAFLYQVCSVNDPALCANATVSVFVDAAATFNHPPVLDDLTRSTIVDRGISGSFVGADPDPGQTTSLTYTQESGASGLAVDANGSWTYTPPPGVSGRYVFRIAATDIDGNKATAELTIIVQPVAIPDTILTTVNVPVEANVTANDLGTVGPPTVVTDPAHGTATVVGTMLHYEPDAGYPDWTRSRSASARSATRRRARTPTPPWPYARTPSTTPPRRRSARRSSFR